jgi:hypothetical protein
MLSGVKHLTFSRCYEDEILRLRPRMTLRHSLSRGEESEARMRAPFLFYVTFVVKFLSDDRMRFCSASTRAMNFGDSSRKRSSVMRPLRVM